MEYPFTQETINGKIRRTFLPQVDSEELKWHQDLKDRKVTIVNDGGWQFQRENELPIHLKKEMQILIPKLEWHRVIKGTSELIVEIEEE